MLISLNYAQRVDLLIYLIKLQKKGQQARYFTQSEYLDLYYCYIIFFFLVQHGYFHIYLIININHTFFIAPLYGIYNINYSRIPGLAYLFALLKLCYN